MVRFYLLTFFIAFILLGCSKNGYVLIPQKCNIEMPEKPAQVVDVLQNVKNIAIYAQELECGLYFCINGKLKDSCVK